MVKRGIIFEFIHIGNHNNSTMRRAMLNIQKGEALFYEVLLLEATIYFEPKINKYQSKKVKSYF